MTISPARMAARVHRNASRHFPRGVDEGESGQEAVKIEPQMPACRGGAQPAEAGNRRRQTGGGTSWIKWPWIMG
jgi:hypothetical protein